MPYPSHEQPQPTATPPLDAATTGASPTSTSPQASPPAATDAPPAGAERAMPAPAPAARSATAAANPDGSGLSSQHHVIALADNLSAIADRLHERIRREIDAYGGAAVPPAVQATMRALVDDELLLRQRANGLYADAAAHVIVGLGQPQGRLMALTAAAAEKIRRIGVVGEVTSLVGGVLSLAGAVASGQPTPIALALEKIELHATALDALNPPTSPA